MSSENKTRNLKLNLWSPDDRPQRIDFVNDNTIIDNAWSEHTQNGRIHLEENEKKRLERPFECSGYTGTGEDTFVIALDKNPRVVFLFANGKPMVDYSGGKAVCYSGIAYAGLGGSGAVELSGTGNELRVHNGNFENSNAEAKLNELGVQYQYILLY